MNGDDLVDRLHALGRYLDGQPLDPEGVGHLKTVSLAIAELERLRQQRPRTTTRPRREPSGQPRSLADAEEFDDEQLAYLRRLIDGAEGSGRPVETLQWAYDEIERLRTSLAQVLDLVANSADADELWAVLTAQGYDYEWARDVFDGGREIDDE